MTNYVFNQLEITYLSEKQLAFVKELLFKTHENGNQIFTMEKFMPKPVTDNQAYIEDWCRSVWGTKNDVHDCFIKQDSECFSIQYVTDWRSNRNWVDNLLRFLNNWCLSNLTQNDCFGIIIRYKYFELALNKGNSVFWTSDKRYDNDIAYNSLNEFVECVDFDTSFDLFSKMKEFQTIYGKYLYFEHDVSKLERNLPVSNENRPVEGDKFPI
jgi:hypothetical protein